MLTSALVNVPANDTTPVPAPAGTVVRHRGEHASVRRTAAEIAKCLRADFKAAIADKGLPAMKFSITSERYSMGQSVTVRVTAAPFGVLNPERVRFDEATRYMRSSDLSRYTPRAMQILARLEAIAAEYVRSETESASDYCNTNCHMDIGFAGALENAERAAILAQSSATR